MRNSHELKQQIQVKALGQRSYLRVTFIIISDDGLESHELHIYICRAVGIFEVGVCWETQQNHKQAHSCLQLIIQMQLIGKHLDMKPQTLTFRMEQL